MDYGPTSWDIDEIPEESLIKLWEVQPNEEDRKMIEGMRSTREVKLGELLDDVVDFALSFTKETTLYTKNTGGYTDNPLLEEPPYEMSNPSFVHWCFEAKEAPILGRERIHTTRGIINSPRLDTVYNVGSSVNLKGLLRGDLVFFNNGRHVGIYVGDGDFVSMDGPNESGSSGKVRRNSLDEEYWRNIFKGHVMRLVR